MEPPLGAAGHPSLDDPEPTKRLLRTGHRNRLKPPFKLRQRGALTLQLEASRTGERTPRDSPLCHMSYPRRVNSKPCLAGIGTRARTTHRVACKHRPFEFFTCKGLPRPEATLKSHGIECQD